MRKILILSANPRDTNRLRLDEEVRDIKEGLKRSLNREQFQITYAGAVRDRDFRRELLETLPNIIHFSGHGAGSKGLYIEDHVGNSHLITGKKLRELFSLLNKKKEIECVLLNGCYSENQANDISAYASYVIGMTNEISDRAAIEFSVGFYDAIGNGESIEFAFEIAKAAIADSTKDSISPILLKGVQANISPINQSTTKEPDSKSELSQNNLLLEDEELRLNNIREKIRGRDAQNEKRKSEEISNSIDILVKDILNRKISVLAKLCRVLAILIDYDTLIGVSQSIILVDILCSCFNAHNPGRIRIDNKSSRAVSKDYSSIGKYLAQAAKSNISTDSRHKYISCALNIFQKNILHMQKRSESPVEITESMCFAAACSLLQGDRSEARKMIKETKRYLTATYRGSHAKLLGGGFGAAGGIFSLLLLSSNPIIGISAYLGGVVLGSGIISHLGQKDRLKYSECQAALTLFKEVYDRI